jgi:hypothetical protein
MTMTLLSLSAPAVGLGSGNFALYAQPGRICRISSAARRKEG